MNKLLEIGHLQVVVDLIKQVYQIEDLFDLTYHNLHYSIDYLGQYKGKINDNYKFEEKEYAPDYFYYKVIYELLE